MNKRIRELARQAGFDSELMELNHNNGTPSIAETFAELIVRECANLCDRYQDIPATEPRHCAQDIRSLFGVE